MQKNNEIPFRLSNETLTVIDNGYLTNLPPELFIESDVDVDFCPRLVSEFAGVHSGRGEPTTYLAVRKLNYAYPDHADVKFVNFGADDRCSVVTSIMPNERIKDILRTNFPRTSIEPLGTHRLKLDYSLKFRSKQITAQTLADSDPNDFEHIYHASLFKKGYAYQKLRIEGIDLDIEPAVTLFAPTDRLLKDKIDSNYTGRFRFFTEQLDYFEQYLRVVADGQQPINSTSLHRQSHGLISKDHSFAVERPQVLPGEKQALSELKKCTAQIALEGQIGGHGVGDALETLDSVFMNACRDAQPKVLVRPSLNPWVRTFKDNVLHITGNDRAVANIALMAMLPLGEELANIALARSGQVIADLTKQVQFNRQTVHF